MGSLAERAAREDVGGVALDELAKAAVLRLEERVEIALLRAEDAAEVADAEMFLCAIYGDGAFLQAEEKTRPAVWEILATVLDTFWNFQHLLCDGRTRLIPVSPL